MKKLFVLISILSITAIGTNAIQAAQWAKTYGGSNEEESYSVQQTSDGGFIMAGYTNSFGAGGTDAWVVKLDSDGTISWEKTYGGSDYDWASSIQQTIDGGYIVVGYTETFGAGGADAWVMKLNSTGGVVWEKTYGDIASDEAISVQQTIDGGYIVAGRIHADLICSDYSTPCTKDEHCPAGETCLDNSDIWVLKLNSDGTISWQNRYGGNDYDSASCIQQTLDEGYIVAGDTWSSISGMTNDSDIVVMKLDSSGNVSWQKSYGDIDNDSVGCIRQTTDGGYILAGDSRSFGGISNIWVLKLNSNGTISWQKTYGGMWSFGSSVQETTAEGYIVAGDTFSFGAGWFDSWVLKLNSDGTISWQKTYGGSDIEWTNFMQETTDLNYIVAGTSYSFGAGESDSWVLKIDSNGDIPDCSIIDVSTATADDTTISAEDSYLVVTSTAATPINTTASILDTSAQVLTKCPYVGEDYDSDGVIDEEDNCPESPNGPLLGTCVKTKGGMMVSYRVGDPLDFITCTSDGDCTATDGTCDISQGNCNSTACGDVCECYMDCNDSGVGDGKITGSDLAVLKGEYGRSDCSPSDPCYSDGSEDGKFTGSDLSLLKNEYGRFDCPSCP